MHVKKKQWKSLTKGPLQGHSSSLTAGAVTFDIFLYFRYSLFIVHMHLFLPHHQCTFRSSFCVASNLFSEGFPYFPFSPLSVSLHSQQIEFDSVMLIRFFDRESSWNVLRRSGNKQAKWPCLPECTFSNSKHSLAGKERRGQHGWRLDSRRMLRSESKEEVLDTTCLWIFPVKRMWSVCKSWCLSAVKLSCWELGKTRKTIYLYVRKIVTLNTNAHIAYTQLFM